MKNYRLTGLIITFVALAVAVIWPYRALQSIDFFTKLAKWWKTANFDACFSDGLARQFQDPDCGSGNEGIAFLIVAISFYLGTLFLIYKVGLFFSRKRLPTSEQ